VGTREVIRVRINEELMLDAGTRNACGLLLGAPALTGAGLAPARDGEREVFTASATLSPASCGVDVRSV